MVPPGSLPGCPSVPPLPPPPPSYGFDALITGYSEREFIRGVLNVALTPAGHMTVTGYGRFAMTDEPVPLGEWIRVEASPGRITWERK